MAETEHLVAANRRRPHRLVGVRYAGGLDQCPIGACAARSGRAARGDRREAAGRSRDPLRQNERLHRRRRHQGIPEDTHPRGGLRTGARRAGRAAGARVSALPQCRRPAWLRAGGRPGARAGLHLSSGCGRCQAVPGVTRGAARHPSGIRRHGARGAAHRRASGARSDAQGQTLQGLAGIGRGLDR